MPAVRDPIEWCSGIFDIKVSFLAGAKMKTSIFWVGAASKNIGNGYTAYRDY